MKVNLESPVGDKESYLYKWDSCARKYFNHFEIHKNAEKRNIQTLGKNIMTRWRQPMFQDWRYRNVDLLQYRQLLGDISRSEVIEANKVLGVCSGTLLLKSKGEPALIKSHRWATTLSLFGLGGLVGTYAHFIRKYNILWLVGSFMPAMCYMWYNSRRPA